MSPLTLMSTGSQGQKDDDRRVSPIDLLATGKLRKFKVGTLIPATLIHKLELVQLCPMA